MNKMSNFSFGLNAYAASFYLILTWVPTLLVKTHLRMVLS